jgi:hypothetical protein
VNALGSVSLNDGDLFRAFVPRICTGIVTVIESRISFVKRVNDYPLAIPFLPAREGGGEQFILLVLCLGGARDGTFRGGRFVGRLYSLLPFWIEPVSKIRPGHYGVVSVRQRE